MHYKQWIPEMVKSLRESNTLTLEKLAALCGLSLSYISDIERGRAIPTIETLDKLFRVLGVTLTLGVQKGYIPPDYMWIKRSTVERLKAVIGEIEEEESHHE